MTEIHAFVGHSFTEDDADVVRKFLAHFDRLSKSALPFSWVDAEDARPEELAAKVMARLSDANVFIGICTKRERVVPSISHKGAFFRRGVLEALERDSSWKTSDCIIQEIGLAKGKDLKLILLLENGDRNPGGLQGNIEYIPFDRATPEKCFDKILEMINAISPATTSPSPKSSDMRAQRPEEDKVHETPQDDAWTTPRPDWDRINYEIAFRRMTLSGDASDADRISLSYLESEDAAQGDNKASWEAFREYTSLGRGGNLAKLKTLSDANPDSYETLTYLARGYTEYHDHANAASAYELAALKVTDDSRIIKHMGLAAVHYARAESLDESLTIIKEMKKRVDANGREELRLLEVLRTITAIEKADEATLALMERIVEVEPSDVSARFALAYKHSQVENDDLALLHYLKIRYRERNAMTWNNLGVAFEQFSLPAKSVDAYRKSKELSETLALSNLALTLMSAGFLPEAQEECDTALATLDYHKNIGDTLAKLKSMPGEEDEKEAELLKEAEPKSDFFRRFGRAVSRTEPREIVASCVGPDCVLAVTIQDKEFCATGSYEKPTKPGLASALAGLDDSLGSNKDSARFGVRYAGTLRGRAVEARVSRTRRDAPPRPNALLGSLPIEVKVLMVLADDESEISAMEIPSGSGPHFYTLKPEGSNV